MIHDLYENFKPTRKPVKGNKKSKQQKKFKKNRKEFIGNNRTLPQISLFSL